MAPYLLKKERLQKMRLHYLILSLSTVFLSACGGGGSSSSSSQNTATQTGTFVDSPVSGLSYSTPTHSGLTNDLGEFAYLEGEQVSFSLGNTFLGVTQGAKQVTPFDLTGIKPLDSELEITNALQATDANSFDRAINIATLLQTLDNDANPDNGIDLKNADSLLTNIKVPLFVKASNFTKQTELSQAKAALGIASARAMGDSVKHLYSSLSIKIKSKKIAKKSTLQNKTPLETITFDYTQEGKVLTEKTDINNDGKIDNTKSFAYDTNGNITSINNSATQSVETLNYDSQQNLISRSTTSPLGQNNSEVINYQNQQLTSFEYHKNSNGAADTTTKFTYDPNGKLSGYTVDINGDTITDTSSSFTYLNNKLTRYTEDSNNDGLANVTILYKYDQNGNKVSQNINSNPNSASYSSSHFEYDQNNNPLSYTLDKNLDGKADYIEAYQYNNNHQRTVYKRDVNGNGKWDFMAQYFYDKDGNRIRMIEDSDGNGIVDKIWQADIQPAVLNNTWDQILSRL